MRRGATGHDRIGDNAAEQQALVALSLVSGVGPARVQALVQHFGSAQAAVAASAGALQQVNGVGPQTARAIAAFDDAPAVEEQFRRARQVGATLVTLWDERYPARLRQIYDPPVGLWLRGTLGTDDDRAIAVVGTRRATDYGKAEAHRFAAELVEAGFTVVSGLAYGVDAAAHRGALDAGGRTLAVLGSGVDRIYPTRHTRLARRISEQGGVLSEYALGAAPDAPNFPRRNRVISGLTLGTLVVEAFEKGGALITARLAVEQDREVFAVPSSVHNQAGVGTNRLIQRGHAKLVLSVGDILDELNLAPLPQTASSAGRAAPDLNGPEQALWEALGAEPLHVDVLCRTTGLDPSSALVYLLSLEFKGLARQLAGKQFLRA